MVSRAGLRVAQPVSCSSCRRCGSGRGTLVEEAEEVAPVGVTGAVLARQRRQLLGADPAPAEGDLLGASDLRALARLEHLDEVRGLQQALINKIGRAHV